MLTSDQPNEVGVPVVRGATPWLPTAQADSARRRHTAFKACVVPAPSSAQLTPRSMVPKRAPPSPTTQPNRAPANDTLRSVKVVSVVRPHEAPPSTVLSTTPALPQAKPVSGSVKHTSVRFSEALTATRFQLAPASVVCISVPKLPTAQPSSALVNHTPLRLYEVRLACDDHWAPAFPVWMIAPASPTAQPDCPSGWKNTPWRFRCEALGWTTHPESRKTKTVAYPVRPPLVLA